MYIYIHIVEALYNDVLPLSMIMRASPSPHLDSILSVFLDLGSFLESFSSFLVTLGDSGAPRVPKEGPGTIFSDFREPFWESFFIEFH